MKEKIDGGADDIAFVDLNTLYVEWMNEETSRITALNPSLSPSQAMDFYYRSVKGSSVDGTHLNDAGADRAAYCFFEAARDIVAAADSGAADKYVLVQANVLRPIAEGMKTKIGDSDTDNLPMTVADEIIAQGSAPNAFWDTVPSDAMEYDNSIAVDSVGAVTNSDGSVTIDSVGIRLMNSGVMYAKAVVTVTEKDAQTVYYTESNYDCTGDEAGTVKVNSGFITSDKPHDEVTDADRVETITIPAGAECEIQIVSCDDKWTVGDSPEIYSAPYGIYPEQAVIFDENCSSSEGWGRLTGAAEYSETVESDADGSTYLSIISSNADANGTKKNYGFYKELNESLSTGRYRLSIKTRFGSGAVRFALATSVQSASNPFPQKVYVFGINGGNVYMNEEKNAITTYINDSGTEENAIRANEWINIDSIIDLDRGKVLISAAGSDYAEFDIAGWQTNFPSSLPLRYFGIAGSSDGTPTDVDISDIRMVRIPQDCSQSRTVRVAADSAMGTVYIDGEPLVEKSVPVSSSVTLKASAAEGYRFTGWIDAEGNILSESAEYVIPRLYNDISVTAGFEALAEGEKAWDFSKYTEAVAADEPMQLEYDGLEIHLGSGDSVTDGGIYWATPGGVKADGITTVSNNRYIVYTPEVSGTLSVTFSGSQYHSKSKAPRVYVISGDDTSCMTKNNSDSGASATATAANTPTVVTAELEAGKTYYIWAYYYGDSRTAFTVSNMGFSPAE